MKRRCGRLGEFLVGTLRGRIILSVAAVHALMMSLFIFDSTVRQRSLYLNNQRSEAMALSQSLATAAADWIAADDTAGLQELVEAERRYPELRFAVLTDESGLVLADTDETRLGMYLLDLPGGIRQSVLAESAALVDVITPATLGERHVGWARVGIGQGGAAERLSRITVLGILYALSAIVLGSLVAWRLGGAVTRRLYVVQDTMAKVRSGERGVRSELGGTDEAASMAREFNALLDRLDERDRELSQSEAMYRSLVTSMAEGVVFQSADGAIIAINPAAENILGLSSELMLGRSSTDSQWGAIREDGTPFPGELHPAMLTLRTGEPQSEVVMGIHRPDGSLVWISINSQPLVAVEGGSPYAVVTTFHDITAFRRAEEALRENESRLMSFFEDSPISIWEEDFSEPKRRIDEARSLGVRDWGVFFEPIKRVAEFASSVKVLDVNRRTLKLFEYDDKSDILGSLPKIFGEGALETFRAELVALASGKRSFEGESVHATASGRPIFVQLRLSLLSGHDEDWSRVLVSLVDVTERRKAERALQASEAKYRGLVEQSSEGIMLLDGSGNFLDCNAVLERLSGLDKRKLVGRKVWDFEAELLPKGSPTEESREGLRAQWKGAIASYRDEGRSSPFEAIFERADGTRLIVEQTLYLISTGAETVIGGIIRDVTERREAARALMASLREKELLLQEVHHRVKNNLQIICSLIHLQLGEVDESSPTGHSLVDMEARVRSMSLVHELLYQSEDFAVVEFGSYLRQLCDYLLSAYMVDDRRIRIGVSVEDVSFALDNAIPCGLLVNELVVNALKHAFPGDRTGTIEVALAKGGDGMITLTICDDGVGFSKPEHDGRKAGTIGLTLVENLARQLYGTFEIEGDRGTRARVVFPA